MAGIYLHIPFCKTRCVYCDFYSTTRPEWQERYVDALCKELETRAKYLQGETVETIYFGGGTPSQLPQKAFDKIFHTLNKVYGLEHCKEITIEANPDDLNESYITMLKEQPFNRISIGIQTFHDTALRLLNRRHTSDQAINAVKACRHAGFENISIDLMYGLPGETLEEWKADIRQAIALGAEHISAYHLIYEEGTELWKMREAHKVEETDEESSVLFFTTLIEELTRAGYVHYEISNFCRPDCYSRHNSSYWKGIPYLGCGAAAHSYDGKEYRQWNVSSLELYIKGIEQGNPDYETEHLDLPTRYNEFVITSLRTMWGLSLHRLREQFGKKLYDYCLDSARPYLDCGKLMRREDTLKIGREGIFVSDGIMSDLLYVDN